MTLHIYADIEQGSPEWMEIRRGILTASVMGQLITPATIKPANNDTSRGLHAQLAAERVTGWTDPTFVNSDMMRGVLHEPIARDRYAEVNGVEVVQVGFMIREDWGGIRIGASPDGLVGEDGGVEIKCPRAKGHVQTIIAGRVPAFHMAQVQTCLLVTGRSWWDYVSFSAGLPLFTKRVLPEQKWHDSIIAAATSAEHAIGQMTAQYERAAEGLPGTEYIPDDFDLVV